MEIESIIYQTTRAIYSIEDKLSIATIFLFCYQLDGKKFAELLYTDKHEQFIAKLNAEFKKYEIDLHIKLTDKNVRVCFYETLKKVKEKYDIDGYYKALFNNDPFALVIDEIVNYNFDEVQLNKITNVIAKQLKLNL